MINNRQNGNGRRRGRSGGAPRPNGNGGGADRGSRVDNRARGNASQLHEKYKTLASDAQRQGDRVMTEYYLQFADHYFRVLSESRSRFEEQQPQRQARFEGGDDFYGDEGDSGDERFEDRGGERAQQQPRGPEWDRGGDYQDEARGDNARRDGNRNEGQRGDGQRNEGQRNEGQRGDAYRGDGQRGDGQRGEGQRGNRAERMDGQRGDNRGEGNRGDAAREPYRADARSDRDGNRAERPARDDQRQPREDRQPRDERQSREDRQPRDERQAADERQPRGERPVRVRRGVEPRIEEQPAEAPAAPAPVRDAAPAPIPAELPLDVPAEPVAERRPRGRPRKVAAEAPAADAEASERMEMDRLPPSLSAEPAEEGEDKPRRRTRRPRGETAPVEA